MDSLAATVAYEEPRPGIARVVLDRPATGNAQNTQMTFDLNTALLRAAHDDAVRVIVIGSAGRHFSTGHDLKDHGHDSVVRANPPIGVHGGIDTATTSGFYAWERELYLDACRRWRSIPKPVIAEVHGACFGGGLMLAWIADLIVASEDAIFCDPVINIGANGVEFFAHPWEIGSRRAKEKLFTADQWTAHEAHDWGMVNHVVPVADLQRFTLDLALKIAAKPSFALKMAKESVNACMDAQGLGEGIDRAFLYHQLCHAHNRQEFGGVLDPRGLPETVLKSGNLSKLVAGDR